MVEDDPAVLKVAKQLLEAYGYSVLPAKSPEDALQLARDHKGSLDLVMTDVIMPEMHGHELATRLAAIHPGVKILYSSGYPADVIAKHGVVDEHVQFIQKPYSMKALVAKMSSILQGP